MKYVLLLFLTFSLMSCGAAYQANQVEKNLKGDWVLESVTFPDSSGFFEVELFYLADVKCFENSIWKFIPNNSSGEFTLDGNDCIKTEQEFKWYIDAATAESAYPELLFKITTGQKPKNVNQGTRIKIKSLLEDQMIWEQNAMFKGKAIKIEMIFSKL